MVGVVYVRSTPDTSSRYDVDATAAGLRATARVPLFIKISRGTADNPPAGELLDVTHLGSGGRVSEGRGWLWFFAYNGEARERYNVLYRYYDRIGGGEGDFTDAEVKLHVRLRRNVVIDGRAGPLTPPFMALLSGCLRPRA